MSRDGKHYLLLLESDPNLLMEELWIEKIARITKLEQLGTKLFKRDGLGPYILLLFLFIITDAILQTIGYLRYGWIIFELTPLVGVMTYIALLFGVWAIKKFRSYYYSTFPFKKGTS